MARSLLDDLLDAADLGGDIGVHEAADIATRRFERLRQSVASFAARIDLSVDRQDRPQGLILYDDAGYPFYADAPKLHALWHAVLVALEATS
jgi:hypothetical protein